MGKTEIQKFEYLENGKNFLDELKGKKWFGEKMKNRGHKL